jgi:acyl carrier protein
MISSRTPEGFPSRCPLCGAQTDLEFSDHRDAPCPNCGHLLWQAATILSVVQQRVAERLGINADSISPETIFADLGADSLDVVELVMELEEELNIDLADEDAAQIHSVSDAIRFIDERRRSSSASVSEERRLLFPETINPEGTASARRVACGIIERIAAAVSIAGLIAVAVAYGATGHIVHTAASGQHVSHSTIISRDIGYAIALFCGPLGIVLASCVMLKLRRTNRWTRLALCFGLLDVLLPFLYVV